MEEFVTPPLSTEDLPPATPPSPARRRRDRRLLSPLTESGRGEVREEVARNASASIEFFVFIALAALILAAGLLFNHPTLIVASALAAPVLAPVLGLALASATGSARFFIRMLAGFLVGALVVMAFAALAGWIGQSQFRLDPFSTQSLARAQINLVDLLLAFAGGVFTALALARSPQAAAVPSVALAYELLPPLGVIGFGLARSQPLVWQGGLTVFAVHLATALLGGVLIFWILGFRPLPHGAPLFGVPRTRVVAGLLIALILAGNLFAVRQFATQPSAGLLILVTPSATPPPPTFTPTIPPTATFTATPEPPTATRTPVPTATFTPTPPPSPTATPSYARVQTGEGSGAVLRDAPEGRIIASLPEDTLLEIIGGPEEVNGIRWIKVRDTFGQVGWVADFLFATVTPRAP